MNPELFFNAQNLLFWAVIGLVVYAEAKAYNQKYGEDRRFWIGYVTLFGLSLLMVLVANYDFYVWLTAAVLVAVARLVRSDRLILGDLWDRRENHRWTLIWGLCFLFTLVPVLWTGMGLLTWGAMFCALGVCGATKVAYEGIRDSRVAKRLRNGEKT